MGPELEPDAWLELLTEILERTQSGKLEWRASAGPGAYVAHTNRAAVVLDRIGSAKSARYRMRFSREGEIEFTDTIMQTMGALPEERQIDAVLALLYQIVSAGTRPLDSAAAIFEEDLLRGE